MNMLKLTRATFVVATTLTVGLAQADGAKYNTADYAQQDHLLAQWDGIENAGRGVRDEQAQTWVDLTGKHDDFVFPNGPVRLNGNCFNTVATSDGKDHGCYLENCADIAHAISDTDKIATIEIVCDFASSAVGGDFVTCYDDQGTSGRILEAAAGPNWGGIYHCMNVVNFCSKDWGNYRQLEMGVLNRVRTYVFSCLSSAMTIMKDGGAVIGTVNRGNADCNLDKAWLSLGFPRAPSDIDGASAPDVKIYAVRIYDRQLTPEELARNWAIDQARFMSGNYRLKPVLEIAGDPLPAGTPAPGYGQVLGLEEGVSTNCTAPAVVSEGGVTATCLGWELQTYDEATQQWGLTRQSGADDKLVCTFTMGTSDARLVWKWDARVAPASKIRTVGRGQVQSSAGSVVLGEKVTFTAVPNAGFVFDHWEGGDVPAGQERVAAIEVTVNDLSALTVVFLPDGTGAYEAKDYVAQDHLLAHWDGIENSGRGYRDEEAETWVDLTGKHDDLVFPYGPDYRDGKCYYLGKGADGKIHAAGVASVEDIARAIASGKATVEVVYEFNSIVSGSALFQCVDSKNDSGRVFYAYVNETYALGCVEWLQNTWKILKLDNSPLNSVLSYSFCFEDMTIKKNGANTGWSFAKGPITPDYSKVGLAVGSFFNWANGEWVMQPAEAANDAKIYAVRIYDRQLTADELARNWAVDQARFVQGRYSVRGAVSDIIVEGAPVEIGMPDPDYGAFPGLKPGDSHTFNAPEPVTYDGFSATCAGWKLYRFDEVTMDWTPESESDASNRTRCDFTQGDWTAKLVWQWDCRAEIRAAVSGSGRVDVSETPAAYGALVTCTAEPDDGSVFDHWEGDVPAGSVRSPALSLTVGTNAVELTAVFVAIEGTSEDLTYVGANGGSWDVASNWSPAKVPTLLDNVTISDGKSVACGGALRARSVTVSGSGASLTVGDGIANLEVSILGDFAVTDGAQVRFCAGRTDGIDATDWESSAKLLYAQANAGSVRIGGLLRVGVGSTLYAQNDALTGTPVFFKPKDFAVENGATVSAAGLGFKRYLKGDWTAGGAPVGATFGYCIGRGGSDTNYYSYAFGKGNEYLLGGGYGGATGNGGLTYAVNQVADAYGALTTVNQRCGDAYGFAAAPFLPGSPEGAYRPDLENYAGGGSVCVFASGTVTVDGVISSDADGWNKSGYAGASGGSVWLAGKVFSVSRSAELTARGGGSNYGATGGGGRIALTAGASQTELDALAAGGTPTGLTTTEITEVNARVSGGSGGSGDAGTKVFTYVGSRVVPTLVTADGEESGVVSPVYGFHVFDRSDIPEFSSASGSGAAYDPVYRDRRRTSLSKIVFTDATGEIESLATAVGPSAATWEGQIEASLRVKVVGGGTVTVNGMAYDADAEIWLSEDAPVVLTAADGTGSFVKFVGDIPGGTTKDGTVSVPVRPGMIVQAVFSDAVAEEKTFVGADGAFWDEDANWEPAGVPAAVDAVTVTNAVKCYNVLAAGSLAVDGGRLLVGSKAENDTLLAASTWPDDAFVTGVGLFVADDVSVSGTGEFALGARLGEQDLPDVEIGGGLSLADAARMTVRARPYPADAERDANGRPVLTNFYRTASAVKVGGTLALSGTAQLRVECDIRTGNPLRFDVGGNVTIGEGAKVNARMGGFGWVDGTTQSTSSGASWGVGGTYAGFKYAPYAPGAPSGNYFDFWTRGGGVIWIKTPGRIVLDGTLDASGACRHQFDPRGTSGGSSGGGIWLVCSKLVAGEQALALACGGYCSGKDGAGGGGGSVCWARKVADVKLAQLTEGKSVRGCTFADEIEALATDVTGRQNPDGSSAVGPDGTAVTVTGNYGMSMIIR